MYRRRLTVFAGAAVFATLLATSALAAKKAPASTPAPNPAPNSDLTIGDAVLDTDDMDAAESEIRRELHSAHIQIVRTGDTVVVSLGDILFTVDSSEVSSEGTAAAKALAAVLVKRKRLTLEVNGYTDTAGSAQHNQTLSESRANAVAQILETNGVDAARVTAQGFGETHLAVATGDGVKEVKNRRVEIVIHFHPRKKAGPVGPKKAPAKKP